MSGQQLNGSHFDHSLGTCAEREKEPPAGEEALIADVFAMALCHLLWRGLLNQDALSPNSIGKTARTSRNSVFPAV